MKWPNYFTFSVQYSLYTVGYAQFPMSNDPGTDLGTPMETFTAHMLLFKNPQFLPIRGKTLSKSGTYEYLILTKFHHNFVKIVNFLIKVYVL